MPFVNERKLLLGIPGNTTSHSEKFISTLGAGLGILVVTASAVELHRGGLLALTDTYGVVASMGASAVLLFAVPHGALSQPWAVFAGQLISAFVGVSCYQLLGDASYSAALAVALAVGAMYYLRCIHPPGGATALTAVIGSESVHALGYQYLLVPVLINTLLILVVAIGFNYCFPWRRYPAHVYFRQTRPTPQPPSLRQFELTQEDFSAAIQKHDSFIDITEEGLTELLELAKQHAEMNTSHPAEIVAGKFYSNGRIGQAWSIRQVVDASEPHALPSKDRVIYKVVAGDQSYETGICTREEFRNWARFEVVQSRNRWVKAL